MSKVQRVEFYDSMRNNIKNHLSYEDIVNMIKYITLQMYPGMGDIKPDKTIFIIDAFTANFTWEDYIEIRALSNHKKTSVNWSSNVNLKLRF